MIYKTVYDGRFIIERIAVNAIFLAKPTHAPDALEFSNANFTIFTRPANVADMFFCANGFTRQPAALLVDIADYVDRVVPWILKVVSKSLKYPT